MDATADQVRVGAALNRWLQARGQARRLDDPELLAARAALVHVLEDAGWRPPRRRRRLPGSGRAAAALGRPPDPATRLTRPPA